MSEGTIIFDTTVDTTGAHKALRSMGSLVSKATKGVGLALGSVSTGLGLVAKNALTYNSSMEQYMTSFTTMLGDEAAATKHMAELKAFAAATPFEMTGLANASQTLLAFGVQSGNVMGTLKMLGDVSQGNQEKFKGLALVFGQISSTGKLMGQDLLQLINQGFNPLQVISKATGASVADLKSVMSGERTSSEFAALVKAARREVKKLGDGASDSAKALVQMADEGQISADQVTWAFQLATGEGGQFYNAMEAQSKTLSGRLSTLKDDFQAFTGEVFEPASAAAANTVLPMLSKYLADLSKAYKENGVRGLTGALGDVVADAVTNISGYAPRVIELGSGIITALVTGLTKNSKKIADGLSKTLTVAVKGLSKILPKLLTGAVQLAVELISAFAGALPGLLPEVVDGLVDGLVRLLANVPGLIAAGVKIVGGLLSGIIKAIPTLVSGLWRGITALFTGRDFQSEVDAYVEKNVAPIKTALDALSTSMQTAKETLSTSLVNAETNYASAGALLDDLERFNKIEYPTDAEVLNAQALVQAIVGLYPELADKVDASGVFSIELSEVRTLTQAYRDMATAKAYATFLSDQQIATAQAQFAYDKQKLALQGLNDELAQTVIRQEALRALIGSPAAQDELYGDVAYKDSEAITAAKKLIQDFIDMGNDVSFLGALVDENGTFVGTDSEIIADALHRVYNATAGEIAALDPEIALKQAAIDAANTALTDLQTQLTEANTELELVRQTYEQWLNGTTAEKTNELAKDGIKGMADAFAEDTTVDTEADNLVKGAAKTVRTVKKDFVKAGGDLAAGIAAGIDASSGLISTAVKNAIMQALKAGKKAARIESPSKLFRDEIGAMLSAGAAQGVDKGAHLLGDSVTKMLSEAEARAKLRAANLSGLTTLSAPVGYGVTGGAQVVVVEREVHQSNTFNTPVQTPDEFAATMRQYFTYGLAGGTL